MLKKVFTGFLGAAALSAVGFANAAIIIDNNTGGLYNNSLGDMADYYGPSQFPGANSSEGDPTINPLSEPTTFGSEFGTDWLNGDYTGGNWGSVSNVPNSWTVNMEAAIVYDFTLSSISDLHMDLGVDNGIYVWLNGNYLFGAMAPGGASLSEYDIDVTGLGAGSHSLQILLEDHGGGTGYQILVDAVESTSVPEPASLGLMSLGLLGLAASRRRYKS